jgi:uncharacterized membrane protein YkoI
MNAKTVFAVAGIALLAGAAGGGATLWLSEERHEGGESGEQSERGADSTMRAEAKITQDSAGVIALAHVPGGKIGSGALEREDDALIYSFDITVAGKDGVEEVHVDAITGKFLKQAHESAAEEAAEKGKEHADKEKEEKRAPEAKKPPK